MNEIALPDSPFIPGMKVQLVWDSTSLGWYKSCPRAYYYRMIEGWTPKAKSIHIDFGQIYHSALEFYYKDRASGDPHNEALLGAVNLALELSADMASDDPNKNRETLVRSVIWYLEDFEHDAATTVILPDGRPAVELTFKFELDFGPIGYTQPYILSGHIDRLVDFAGLNYVMDHKTSKQTITQYYYKQFSPNNQISLYTLAAQVVYQTAARGVIIDAIQVAQGFSKPDRGIAYRRPSELNEWLADLKVWLRRAEEDAKAEHWPINDTACRLCPFQQVCEKEPSQRQNILESNFTKEFKWNPAVAR